MACGCCNIFLLVIGLLGVVLIILGPILGFAVFPPIVDDEITETVQLKEDTEQYDRWLVTPMPFKFSVYIFHVTNPDDVIAGTAIPIVEEKGPYIYTQSRKKSDVNYNEGEDTLEYLQNLEFTFDAENSESQDETVTVLNVALQGILQLGEDSNPGTLNRVWSKMFQDSPSIFHTIKVRNLLFDGYKFCDPAQMQGVEYTVANGACRTVQQQIVDSDTIVIDDDNALVFSFFKHKELNPDGPYIINAGNTDVNQIGAIQSWKGKQFLDTWEKVDDDDLCNKIRGRDSSIYPPFNNDTSSFDVFNTDICRIVELTTSYKSSFKDIDGYVARLGKDAMSNTGKQECYCTKATKNLNGERECLPEGFGDMQTCTSAPVITSFPHFLWADSSYAETVEGLSPDEDKHATFVMIEPGTGSPLKGAKRMQFNMVIRPLTSIAITNDIIPAMMPILWVEESVELSDDLVQQLKDDYLDKLVIIDAVTYTLLGVGIVLFIIGIGGYMFRKCRS